MLDVLAPAWLSCLPARLVTACSHSRAYTWQQIRGPVRSHQSDSAGGADRRSTNRGRRKSRRICARIRTSHSVVGSVRSVLTPIRIGRSPAYCAFQVRRSAICTSGSTSANCAWRARRRRPEIACSMRRTRSGRCCSICATRSCRRLQAKAVLALAKENLAYYDQVLELSRDRLKAGDIAQVDLDRLELQRVQYESDVQTATVNLRTAKIQLLTLLNDRTPVEQFDVTGHVRFRRARSRRWKSCGSIALDARPDLKAAVQAVDKAKTDYQLAVANGSTDPTFGVDFGRNPPHHRLRRRQRDHSAAHLRPQSGREGAHAARYPPQRAAAGSGRGAGFQRRGFRLRDGEQQPDAAASVQGQVSATGGAGARHDFISHTSTAARRCWIFCRRSRTTGRCR